ncbi:MAG: uncharacterized protein JWO53_325 [Chlamydiia bacterium]|nr:uncharacterized protein [Chlamydiia bacterium]
MIHKIIAYLLRIIVTLLFWTLRVEIRGASALKKLEEPTLIAIWHSQLLLLAPLIKKVISAIPISILISKSRDGNIPAAYAATYPRVSAIRVGHKGRHHALLEVIHTLDKNHLVIITPDGPRGPIYTIKPGIIFAAKKCSAPIIAMSWKASRCIRLNSWDKFCIPLPFSKITVTFSPPLAFSEGDEPQTIENELKKALDTSSC